MSDKLQTLKQRIEGMKGDKVRLNDQFLKKTQRLVKAIHEKEDYAHIVDGAILMQELWEYFCDQVLQIIDEVENESN